MDTGKRHLVYPTQWQIKQENNTKYEGLKHKNISVMMSNRVQ